MEQDEQVVYKVIQYRHGLKDDIRSCINWNLWETEYPLNEWVKMKYPSLAFKTVEDAEYFLQDMSSMSSYRLDIYKAMAKDVKPVYDLLPAHYLDVEGAVEWFWDSENHDPPHRFDCREPTPMVAPSGTVGCGSIKLLERIELDD
jgi:hypothetical protein